VDILVIAKKFLCIKRFPIERRRRDTLNKKLKINRIFEEALADRCDIKFES